MKRAKQRVITWRKRIHWLLTAEDAEMGARMKVEGVSMPLMNRCSSAFIRRWHETSQET